MSERRGNLTQWAAAAGLALCALLTMGAPAQAWSFQMGGDVEINADGRKNIFAMGGDVQIDGRVENTVRVMGGDVEIDATIGGDVFAMGGDVEIYGVVEESIFAMGGSVTIGADVTDDLRAIGADIDVAREAVIAGDADLAGAYVEINGEVEGDVLAAAEDFEIAGRVGGSVYVTAENLTILPGARVDGEIVHRGPEAAELPDDAEILGGYRFEYVEPDEFKHRIWTGDDWDLDLRLPGLAGVAVGAVMAALIGFVGGAILAMICPGLFTGAARAGVRKPVSSLLTGLGTIIVIPAVAIALIITLIGAWIGLALFAAFGLLTILGALTAGFVVGHWILDREVEKAGLLPLLLGMVLLAMISMVPVAGQMIAFVIFLIGLGAMSGALFRALRSEA